MMTLPARGVPSFCRWAPSLINSTNQQLRFTRPHPTHSGLDIWLSCLWPWHESWFPPCRVYVYTWEYRDFSSLLFLNWRYGVGSMIYIREFELAYYLINRDDIIMDYIIWHKMKSDLSMRSSGLLIMKSYTLSFCGLSYGIFCCHHRVQFIWRLKRVEGGSCLFRALRYCFVFVWHSIGES